VIRVPEKELMCSNEQAASYANANFSESNNLFINNTFQHVKIDNYTKLLDVGCGDGEIPIRISKETDCEITAIDGSQAMLNEFKKKIDKNNVRNIFLHKKLIDQNLFLDKSFDVIICNSVLHHVSDLSLFWNTIFRLTRKNGIICLMDLERPKSNKEMDDILLKYGGKDPILLDDFKNSLKAAYTINEVSQQLDGYNNISFNIKAISDRHFFVNIEMTDDTVY
jgi:ubiquinone/menaquinone biosynthesis C-methylase UbiE